MRWILLALAALVVGGCHPASPLVGAWEAKNEALKGTTGTTRVDFAADGKMTVTTKLAGGTGLSLTAIDTGTWKLDGNTLTIHRDDVNWTFEGPGAELARQKFEARRAEILANANKSPTETIAWEGNDTFVSTDSTGNKETYRRIK